MKRYTTLFSLLLPVCLTADNIQYTWYDGLGKPTVSLIAATFLPQLPENVGRTGFAIPLQDFLFSPCDQIGVTYNACVVAGVSIGPFGADALADLKIFAQTTIAPYDPNYPPYLFDELLAVTDLNHIGTFYAPDYISMQPNLNKVTLTVTYTDDPPRVPEPGAIFLVAVGLLSVACLRKRLIRLHV